MSIASLSIPLDNGATNVVVLKSLFYQAYFEDCLDQILIQTCLLWTWSTNSICPIKGFVWCSQLYQLFILVKNIYCSLMPERDWNNLSPSVSLRRVYMNHFLSLFSRVTSYLLKLFEVCGRRILFIHQVYLLPAVMVPSH